MSDSPMECRAEGMDRIHHSGDVVGVHIRVDAVAEVEDMSGAPAVAPEHPPDFLSNALRRGIEDTGVQVPLEGHPILYQTTGVGQVLGPIHAQGVAAACRHPVQPPAATLGKEDDRDPSPLRLAGKLGDDAGHIVQ